ncbi:hypothetical protein OGAPHI_005058 [Ogataea philodendri]|uniref:Uncharacterized protein n=1 Tax=Ogataea philodendri TaxID=1378263 RepID=A0A9P8P2L3_9ASCO|nr:uncharacterized protein OGAPHI_005058 [Ogataea philodendri]KAH3663657.1 hypothetical protein OGAPHI_005058 [Ogataea philodendri]
MSKRQLDQFSNLSHLLSASTNIVVTDLIEVVFFVLSVDRFSLRMYYGVLRNDGVFFRLDFNDLELDLSHTTSNNKVISLTNGSVGVNKIWFQKHIKERSGDSLDGIGNWQNRDSGGKLDLRTRMDGDNVSKSDSQIVSCHSVDFTNTIFDVVIGQDDQNGVLSLLTFDQRSVSTEQLQQLHGVGRHGDDRVVIIGSIVDDQGIILLLSSQNSGSGNSRRQLLGKLAQLCHICVFGRPADDETGFWIAFWNQVEMDVVHHLVGDPTVILQNVVADSFWRVDLQVQCLDQFLGHWQDICEVLVRNVVKLSPVVLRDHQKMSFRNWLDVQERVRIFGLHQFERRNISCGTLVLPNQLSQYIPLMILQKIQEAS